MAHEEAIRDLRAAQALIDRALRTIEAQAVSETQMPRTERRPAPPTIGGNRTTAKPETDHG